MAEIEVVSLNSAEGGSSSNTRSISDGNDWIAHLKELLRMKKQEIVHERERMFFRVPQPWVESFEQFYIPDLVCIGPHHFGKPKLRMESHKVAAMHRMESRIQKRYPQRTLKSIVKGEIMAKEKWIRDCYEEEIPYTSKQLAWMVTADACFLYEFIICYSQRVKGLNDEEQWTDAAKYDSIFNSCKMSPTWDRILFNLLLFENQIPFSVLELIIELGMGSQEDLEKKFLNNWLFDLVLTRKFSVFNWFVQPLHRKGENHHLLGVFYSAIVGNPKDYLYNAYEEPQSRSSMLAWLANQNDYIITFLTRFYRRGVERLGLRSSHPSNGESLPKLPSAAELKQKGVKFQLMRITGLGFAPIQCVGFDERTSTLHLPRVCVDHFRLALIRNFIALEVTNEMYAPSPMTNFAVLMNELIDNAEDVRLLSEAGIIVNMLGSHEDVAKALNSIAQGTEDRNWRCNLLSTHELG